ncbi:MAG: PQQ-binding-like beta-propeller repeat protein [Bacillota bacterium]
MRNHFYRALAALSSVVLVSCGGVSETTSSGSVGVELSLDPFSVTVLALEHLNSGFNVDLTVVYKAVDNKSGFNLKLLDPDNVLASSLVNLPETQGSNIITLWTSSNLAPGVYKGALTIEACSDNCTVIRGSVELPYTITVQPLNHLTPLRSLAGVTDWQTEGGNNAHNNYVPVSLDPSKFNSRWLVSSRDLHSLPSSGFADSVPAPVTDASHHQLAVQTRTGLAAFDETDGTKMWEVDPSDGVPKALAFYNGNVYAGVEDLGPSFLEAYAESNGALLFDTPLTGCTGYAPGAPVVVGSTAFILACMLDAFDASAGTPVWSGPSISGAGSPAADNQNMYFYHPHETTPGKPGTAGFTVLDQATGTLQWQISGEADPLSTDSEILNGDSVMLDGAGGAVVNLDGSLLHGPIVRYDLTTKQRIWEFGQSGPGILSAPQSIAVGNGMVYVVTEPDGTVPGDGLYVLDLAKGAVQWKWYPPYGGTIDCILVTKNLMFVGVTGLDGVQTLNALDLDTRKVVWQLPIAATSLSISPSGILYVGTSVYTNNFPYGDALEAINLH